MGRPGSCPACGSSQHQIERCATCAVARYNAWMETPAGELLVRVLSIDQALQLRMHIGLDDVLVDEFEGLKALQYERGEKQREDMERERLEQQIKQRRMQGGHTSFPH